MSAPVQAVGVDIGGTKTAVAVVDLKGKVHGRTEFETRSTRGIAQGLQELAQAIRTVTVKAGCSIASLKGIGIGCAGPVNPFRGTIHNPYTLPGWEDAEIVAQLREQFDIPVFLENDADAAALGEYQFGAGQNASPLVVITLGTGIGGAVLVNGQIHRGVAGDHPELGHIRVETDGPECYCGTRGCWESIASGTGIAAAGKPLGFADSRAVFAARERSPDAARIVRRAVDATVTAMWTVLHTVLPQKVIVGGGIGTEHFELFAEAMRAQVALATQVPQGRVEVLPARLCNDAGVIGAACLALRPLEAQSDFHTAHNRTDSLSSF